MLQRKGYHGRDNEYENDRYKRNTKLSLIIYRHVELSMSTEATTKFIFISSYDLLRSKSYIAIYFRPTRKYFENDKGEINEEYERESERETKRKRKRTLFNSFYQTVSVPSFVSNFNAGIPKSFGSLNSEVNR